MHLRGFHDETQPLRNFFFFFFLLLLLLSSPNACVHCFLKHEYGFWLKISLLCLELDVWSDELVLKYVRVKFVFEMYDYVV